MHLPSECSCVSCTYPLWDKSFILPLRFHTPAAYFSIPLPSRFVALGRTVCLALQANTEFAIGLVFHITDP